MVSTIDTANSRRWVLLSIVALAAAVSAPRAQVDDQDGDGKIDYVLIGDVDGNGSLEDADIMAGLLALEDDVGTAELVAGVFELDPDNDGRGESYGLTCDDGQPHICIPRSGITLRGQGPGLTILRKGQKTPGADYGYNELISLAVDGTTFAQSSERISDVHVRDLSVETVGTCGVPGTNAKAIRFLDCDGCSAVNISCKHLNQSCVDLARCTNSESSYVTAEYVGNYDEDGADPTCTPGTNQPALYLYTSDGFITENTGHRNAQLEHVGGFGVNIRSDGTEERKEPWGVDDYSFNSTQRKIAQVVITDEVYVPRFTGIALPIKRTELASGRLTVELQTVSGGVPDGSVVPGYAASDYTIHDVSRLSSKYSVLLFEHRLTAGYPPRLAGGVSYAMVLSYDGAATLQDVVHVQGDFDGSTDVFEDGDSSTYDGSTWSRKPNADLNFALFNGFHRHVVISGITAEDITAANDQYGTCLNVAKVVDGELNDISCLDAGAILFGLNGVNIEATLDDFQVTATFARSGGKLERARGLIVSPYGGEQIVSNGYIGGTARECLLVPSGANEQFLSDLSLVDCGTNGILIGDTGTVELERITIDSANGDGVFATGGRPIVKDGSFFDNAGCAIRVQAPSASNIVTSGNVMVGNGTDGICVSGLLIDDVEWSSRDVPYVLTSDFRVEPGAALTVRGATVLSEPARGLVVSGSLDARQVDFRAADGQSGAGAWCGIRFDPGSSGTLHEVDLRFAGDACGLADGAALHITDAEVVIDQNSRISESAGDGVFVAGAAAVVTIENTTISNNAGSGIHLSGATALIDGARLILNAEGASYTDGAGGILRRGTIAGNLVAGVFVDGTSEAVLGAGSAPGMTDVGLNSFVCNSLAVQNDGPVTVPARYNWWGVAPPDPDVAGPVDRMLHLLAEPQEVLQELSLELLSGKTDIRLCWDDIAACRGYRVFRGTTKGLPFDDISGHEAASCFTDVAPDPQTAFYYLAEVD